MISVIVKDQGVAELLERAQRTTVNPEPLLRAAGTTLLSITLGNFSAHGAGYRPSPWPPKRDGTPATLKRSGTLSSSFHLTVTPRAAILANPMPYAAIHQFGGVTRPHTILTRRRKVLAWTAPDGGRRFARRVQHPGSRIPARPFVPITPAGDLTPPAALLVRAALTRASRWARGSCSIAVAVVVRNRIGSRTNWQHRPKRNRFAESTTRAESRGHCLTFGSPGVGQARS